VASWSDASPKWLVLKEKEIEREGGNQRKEIKGKNRASVTGLRQSI